jgi:cellulose synthase/poly-beta-1,6-N-acetylglucosamine synthase-like glycosyltransferase
MTAALYVLTYTVWFLATYFIIVFAMLLFVHRKQLYQKRTLPAGVRPAVTIIAPAFNEEGKIHKTIASLKKITYKNVEFIIVNDGSTDGTHKETLAAIGRDKRFTYINRKENKGKAFSLNQGIAAARGDYIACMDADSIVEPGILEKVLPYMVQNEKVGAVTVTVEVSRPRKFIHRIIDIEYNIGLSLFLKVFSFTNTVFVTPGPFSLFRKDALEQIGGFDVTNITEDLEIAYRLHRAGYRIDCCLEAKVNTICPPTFNTIYRQRRRWYSGAIQTWFKHRDMLFNSKYGLFGYFVPLQVLLLFLGMILFSASTIVGVMNTADGLSGYQYTGFNFMDHIFDYKFDWLNFKQVWFIGLCSFLTGITLMFICLHYTRQKYSKKKAGMLGYPLLFFLYQLYWLGAIAVTLRGKRITWR